MKFPQILSIAHIELYTAWLDIEAASCDVPRIVKVENRSKDFSMRAKVEFDPASSSHCVGWSRITSASSSSRTPPPAFRVSAVIAAKGGVVFVVMVQKDLSVAVIHRFVS